MRSFISALCLLLVSSTTSILLAQAEGTITGTVRNAQSQELLSGATVRLEGTKLGAYSTPLGVYSLKKVPPGTYTLTVSYVSYKPTTLYNIVVTSGNVVTINVDLTPSDSTSKSIEVSANSFGKKAETPLSVQSLTTEEIRSNPGGNFDISRAAQALPGIGGATGGASFRNDITVRGGGPNENVYYLDGIEIPQINHFATQGSAGGPAGILNVAFIEELNISSSSFGSRYNDALSSVFSVKQKDGNSEKLQGNIRVSATEVALTGDGPLSENTTIIASARRSYLDLLFTAIDLPIRPNYWDFQFKTTTKLDPKTTLITLGVGAIDDFAFGVPKNTTPDKEYVLRSAPSINQWNYTVGALLRHTVGSGYLSLSVSRNMFNNQLDKFEDAQRDNEALRTLKVTSQEIENKLRVEFSQTEGIFRFNSGINAQYVKYNSSTFNKLSSTTTLNFSSAIDFWKFGIHADATAGFFDGTLTTTLGIRADANTFLNNALNPLNTLSPRLSLSWLLHEQFSINATVGRYYKIPIYTVLGFRDNNNTLVNTNNTYIGSNHYVIGVEYLPEASLRLTAETFYKTYDGYPISVRDGISLANQGTNFGSIGNEATVSTGRGRAFGAEFFIQKKLTEQFFGTLSLTFVRSEFTGTDPNTFIPSAWDFQTLVSAIFGYKFGEGWEIGGKYRYAGGSPYTPFNLAESQRNYLTTGTGTLDYSQLNSLRLKAFNQADIRVDKKWSFTNWSLDVFIDVQNVLGFTNEGAPDYTFERLPDNSTWKTTDSQPLAQDGSNGIPLILANTSTLITPSIGIIIEF